MHPLFRRPLHRAMDAVGATFTVFMDGDHIHPYPDGYVSSADRHPMGFLADLIRERGWGGRRIGVEMDEYYYTARWHQILTAALPDATFVDAFLTVNRVRMKKSEREVGFMMEAGRIAAAAMQATIDAARPGVRQCDAIAELYRVTTGGTAEIGGTFTCKPPNAMAGAYCSAPHLSWTDAPLAADEMFYIELGGCRHRYHAPLSRCIYLGTPTRFFPGRRVLTDDELKRIGTPKEWGYASDCADIILCSARGGNDLKRTFLEAFIRPGRDLRNWTSRANYAARGIVSTAEDELAFFVQHNCGYASSHLRRYTMRADGFVSVRGPYAGGELVTKPLRFSGSRLSINYATSAGGGLQVEIQTPRGQAVEGLALADCPELIGDRIGQVVRWKKGVDLGSLRGKPVRLRFVLRDADLYAIQFGD